jgi:hypothetical protein
MTAEINEDLAGFLSPSPDEPIHVGAELDQAVLTGFDATTVTLTWRGAAGYMASYGAWYNPVAGDKVAVVYGGGKLFCLGKIR